MMKKYFIKNKGSSDFVGLVCRERYQNGDYLSLYETSFQSCITLEQSKITPARGNWHICYYLWFAPLALHHGLQIVAFLRNSLHITASDNNFIRICVPFKPYHSQILCYEFRRNATIWSPWCSARGANHG